MAEDDEGVLLYANADGTALLQGDKSVQIKTGTGISDGLLWDGHAVLGLADGTVAAYTGSKQAFSYSVHAGAVKALSLHPEGNLLASVGEDKSYILYDLSNPDAGAVSRVFADSGTFTRNIYLVPPLTVLTTY